MNSRKLFVSIPPLNEHQRHEISARAGRYGLETLFFDNVEGALPLAADAEIFFGSSADFTRQAVHLRWVCTPSAGINQFTGPEAFCSQDVILTNSSGAYGVTIAEHIIMMTLEVMRRQQEYSAITSEKKWIRNLPVTSIRNCRITLLGTGDIGQETAVRLRAFSPACLIGVNRSGRNPHNLFDRTVPQQDLDTVLPETELLIISLPGTAETYRLLDQRRLSLLPDSAIVVNVGRGSVIQQEALVRELSSGRLRAALDVFETEPIPADDPIWNCPNLLITPHTAGNMTLPYTVQKIVDLFLEDLDAYMQGRPLRRTADLKKGY